LTPAGGRIVFASDTLIARTIWTFGVFEYAELAAAGNRAKRGTCAIDMGANTGLFTVDISRAVGPNGCVIAVEPVASTIEQLRANLEPKRCFNVSVVLTARVPKRERSSCCSLTIPLSIPPGGEPMAGQAVIETTTVRSFTLDELWATAGKPQVSLVKIDVEGAETGVLLGAATMIAARQPAIIDEVVGQERLDDLIDLLPDYRAAKTPGFERWNHLLVSS
jgi:FkbM family methyltransferase